MPLIVLGPDVLIQAFEGAAYPANLLTLVAYGRIHASLESDSALQTLVAAPFTPDAGQDLDLSRHARAVFDRHAPALPADWRLAASNPILAAMREGLGASATITRVDPYVAYLSLLRDCVTVFVSDEQIERARATFPEWDEVTLTALGARADFLVRSKIVSPDLDRAITLESFAARGDTPDLRDLGGSLELLHRARPPSRPLYRDGSDIAADHQKRASAAHDQELEQEFRRRMGEPVRVSRLRLCAVSFFGDTTWDFHPQVNVLLGANGFGKSLLLRTLAGMLQRDPDVTGLVMRDAGPDARIEVELMRGGAPERIERDPEILLRGSPKVPLLAIPDARFTDRTTRPAPDPNADNLALDGARHFLDQAPYQSTIDSLLATLGLEYRLHGSSFDLPAFRLLSRVLSDLTGGQFAFDHVVTMGRIGTEIFVRTEGINRPLPIKQASQGTLSVVAIFGIIQAFLQDIAAESDSDVTPRAIVIIDEVDAHLHPSWQRRIRGLLTSYFPTVQFILTSHSPLVVAGCGAGEVAVLRQRDGGGSFCVDEVPGDFLGATSGDLLGELFGVEDRDPEFVRYANMPDRDDPALLARADALMAKQRLDGLAVDEESELQSVVTEVRRRERVTRIVDEERGEDRESARLQMEIAQLLRRIARLEQDAAP